MITLDGFEIMDFPAGESFVKKTDKLDTVHIVWNYENDSELMKLALLKNVLEERFVQLSMPYIPHARQDRVTAEGYPFSLKVFVELLAKILIKPEIRFMYNPSFNHRIFVTDPHSDVFEKLCKEYGLNVVIKRQWEFAPRFFGVGRYDYVVAPDKGSVEKAAKWASELKIPMLPCSKTRDPATGKLSSPEVPNIDLDGKRLLVVDDICDGGYTFIQLAKALRKSSLAQLDLFVTHGIFSKGLGDLHEVYDAIYTTNSLPHYKKFGTLLTVIDI
jgi:ribose-phosphate pyrophosphokinase